MDQRVIPPTAPLLQGLCPRRYRSIIDERYTLIHAVTRRLMFCPSEQRYRGGAERWRRGACAKHTLKHDLSLIDAQRGCRRRTRDVCASTDAAENVEAHTML